MNKADELRILKNFVNAMSKAYRKQNVNWVIVRDILMNGTSTAGATSCRMKCRELGLDPDGLTLETNE